MGRAGTSQCFPRSDLFSPSNNCFSTLLRVSFLVCAGHKQAEEEPPRELSGPQKRPDPSTRHLPVLYEGLLLHAMMVWETHLL